MELMDDTGPMELLGKHELRVFRVLDWNAEELFKGHLVHATAGGIQLCSERNLSSFDVHWNGESWYAGMGRDVLLELCDPMSKTVEEMAHAVADGAIEERARLETGLTDDRTHPPSGYFVGEKGGNWFIGHIDTIGKSMAWGSTRARAVEYAWIGHDSTQRMHAHLDELSLTSFARKPGESEDDFKDRLRGGGSNE